MDSVSKKIHDLREDHDIKQKDLSEIFQCNSASISNYENGRSLPLDLIIKYCKYFNVSADWLLGLTTDRRPGGSILSSRVDTLAALTTQEGGQPFTADQLSALLDALTAYYQAGAKAGNAPVDALVSFISALQKAVVACSGSDTAAVAASVNAVVSAGLDAHDMLTMWLTSAQNAK